MHLPPRCVAAGALLCALAACPFAAAAQITDDAEAAAAGRSTFFTENFAGFFRGFRDFGDPAAVTGGIGLYTTHYWHDPDDLVGPRQDPFFATLSADVNARFFQLDMPVSFLVTAADADSPIPDGDDLSDIFSDSYAGRESRLVRFGVSPGYKWARLHLGHRAMDFSRFTLSDVNFLGAGAELTPGKVRLAGMYGRLARAEPIDLSLRTPNLPVYERRGWAAQAGYGDEQASVALTLFGARDDETSIPQGRLPDSLRSVAPEENFVVGLTGQTLLFDRIRARLEVALSAISPDATLPELADPSYPAFLFGETIATETNTAFDARIDYEGINYTAGLQLVRVDPNYRSFGTYFFTNDVVDFLANGTFGLLDGEMSVALSTGVQADNLELFDTLTLKRFVYSAAVDYVPGALSLSAAYSNNTSDIGYVLNQDFDSLTVVYVAQDASLSGSYTIAPEGGHTHVLSASGGVQSVTDDIADPVASSKSDLTFANVGYNFGSASGGWGAGVNLTYTAHDLRLYQVSYYGAGATLSKTFLDDRLSVALDGNYLTTDIATLSTTGTLQTGLGVGWQISDAFGVTLDVRRLGTAVVADDGLTSVDPFTEYTGTLGLEYTFGFTRPRADANDLGSDE